MTIPFHITIMAKFISISKYPDVVNESKGEIIKMNLDPVQNRYGSWGFAQQVVGNKEGYNWIYRYIGLNYWKVVSKVKE